MNMEKTLKLAKKFLKFVKGIIIINIVLCIVLFFFSINDGFREFAGMSTSLTLGILKLSLKDSAAEGLLNYNLLSFTCLIVLSLAIIWYLIVRRLETIVNNATKGEIFSPSSTSSLNMIAVYILIHGLINIIITFINSFNVNKYIFSLDIFNSAVVDSVMVNTRFDISFLAIAFVIFILAKVFAYGQELQKLSDETL
ncbi:MAG: hypothetical protein ACI4WM_10645 [Erysipelotrichaceae bacterium]